MMAELCEQLGSSIISMEVLNADLCMVMLGSVLQHHTLTRLSRMKILHKYGRKQEVALLRELLTCTALTHLEVGEGWIMNRDDWLLLPPRLVTLHSCSLPKLPMPQQLVLPHLRTIILSNTQIEYVDVDILANLLRVAPSLILLLRGDQPRNSIVVEDCTNLAVESLGVLHQRMAAGFTLSGFDVNFKGVPADFQYMIETYGALSMLELLNKMPRLMDFSTCVMSPEFGGEALGCLAALALALPELKSLVLTGAWLDSDLVQDVAFPCLEFFHVESSSVTLGSLLRVVAHAPRLTMFRHTLRLGKKVAEQIQGELRATQSEGSASLLEAVDANMPRLGDWTLVQHGAKFTRWGRRMLRM